MALPTFITCAAPRCNYRTYQGGTSGLCRVCERDWLRWQLPLAGYISSLDLKQIGAEFQREHKPTKAEVSQAIRMMRGPRYPVGPWDQRPAYRLQPLLHGRMKQRLSHLLIGRRQGPTVAAIYRALVHYHLAQSVLGAGHDYARWCAGCTFYVRRGVSAPVGAEVLTGGAGHTAYKLRPNDFMAVGRQCLRAGKIMGAIEQSSQPMSTAEKLVAQRISEVAESKIEAMLREHQGRRKRYTYNQAAVIGIEHLVDGPLDPQTQHPIWRDMLRKTKGGTMPKAEYMDGARAILCQHSQYDPQTMAG